MFSKKEAIKFGWNTTKKHFWFFVLILLTSFVIQMIPNLFSFAANRDQAIPPLTASFLVSIAASLLKMIVDLGIIKIILKIIDNQNAVFSDLFSSYRLLWKYLLGSILYSLIIIGGVILLIVPGIIFGIRFQYYNYFIVDKGLGPIEALKQSWRITRGHAWNLFIFGLLLGLLNIAGALVLMVGLLFTIPTTLVAMSFVFRKLQRATTA